VDHTLVQPDTMPSRPRRGIGSLAVRPAGDWPVEVILAQEQESVVVDG
jgi:hypothetical protein